MMRSVDAYRILELTDEECTIDDIKKQYRTMALIYHPDRNSAENATEKFQEVQSAYEYLLKNHDTEDLDEEGENLTGYRAILYSFLKGILTGENNNEVLCAIFQKIATTCEENAVEILNKLDKPNLMRTYDIIVKYARVFRFSDTFVQKICDLVNKRTENDECIILNPTLDDLFENNLYKLKVGEHTYIVPLWHHELVYDHSGNDIYVRCDHRLPNNVVLGPNNNLLVQIVIDIKKIWVEGGHRFYIGKREFHIPAHRLKLVPHQRVFLNNSGVSRINVWDPLDVTNKSDVVVDVTLRI
jgi:hypothetical protein